MDNNDKSETKLKKKKKSKQEQHILNIESTVWNITESATDHLSICLGIHEFLKFNIER